MIKTSILDQLAHIWQNKNGVLNQKAAVISENIRTFGNYENAYPYDLDASKDLLDYSMEQQAAIIEDYFRRLEGVGSLYKLGPEKAPRNMLLYKKVLDNFLKDPTYPRAISRQKNKEPVGPSHNGSQ